MLTSAIVYIMTDTLWKSVSTVQLQIHNQFWRWQFQHCTAVFWGENYKALNLVEFKMCLTWKVNCFEIRALLTCLALSVEASAFTHLWSKPPSQVSISALIVRTLQVFGRLPICRKKCKSLKLIFFFNVWAFWSGLSEDMPQCVHFPINRSNKGSSK